MKKFEEETLIRKQKDTVTGTNGTSTGTFNKTIGQTTGTTAQPQTSNANQSKFMDGDGKKSAKAKNDNAFASGGDADKTIDLSRGLLQLDTEGDFSGGENDITMPCIPVNVHIYTKLTDDEKKTYKGKRYGDPSDNKVFTEKADGNYKMGDSKDRYNATTYTDDVGKDSVLGCDNSSGVTIGFGIDLGNGYTTKDAITKLFKAAGALGDKGEEVAGNKADKLIDTAGLKGIPAAKKAAELRTVVKITQEQALKLLDNAIPAADSKAETWGGYKRGDGTFEPATEEALMAIAYWGEKALSTAITDAAKGKKGAEQFRAASTATTTAKTALTGTAKWKIPGYETYASYFDMLAEMTDSGYTITFKDKVSDKDTLTGAKSGSQDDTLQFVKDLNERAHGYSSSGKDLKKQMTDPQVALPNTIKGEVGERTNKKTAVVTPCANAEDDVEAIQQLLYNGDYDVDVNGTYDDKTKTALTSFVSTEMNGSKFDGVVSPSGSYIVHLRKFKYKKRTDKK